MKSTIQITEEKLDEALKLLYEVHTYQYSFELHDRIGNLLTKNGINVEV